MLKKITYYLYFIFGLIKIVFADNALILQTDFGLKDGAVAEMKGVAFSVDNQLKIYDLTHEIPTYNIWEASYRLYQTASYWPSGTVFVSVVDPGVGGSRKSVVLKTKTGQYFVSPDNGTLTLVAQKFGIDSIRQIDEKYNRLKNSTGSYTFFGRDVYAYTGAKIASGKINFFQVGPLLPLQKVVEIPYQRAEFINGKLEGNIPILDVQFGNIWSNISESLVARANIKKGDILCVEVRKGQEVRYRGRIPYVNTFSGVEPDEPLVYLNSLMNISLALNMKSFSNKYKIYSGPDWAISLEKCN
ncbi:MAG TPA: S-adenosyl-l-methionine hydroxide adenosyltransferase family protein [Burkholderiales bacterium]|nr:S-adenosyl-l-methionine hydroxide adenosyltransferase family protein [Burkholderiales bacterium]